MAARPLRRYGRRKSGGGTSVLLILIGLVIFIALGELATRMAVSRVDDAIGGRTPWQAERLSHLGWSHRPNTLVTWPPGSDNKVQTNAQGFVGPEIQRFEPEEVFRIVVLGDDLVEAGAVEARQSFTHQLQSLLNDQPQTGDTRHVEVINCGVAGYSPVQQLLLLHPKSGNLLARLRPHLVVLTLSLPNDFLESDRRLNIGETVPPVARRIQRPYIELRTRGNPQVTMETYALPSQGFLGWLGDNSALVNLVLPHPAIDAVALMEPELSPTVGNLFQRQWTRPYEETWTLLAQILSEINYLARENDTALLIVSAPDRPELIDGASWAARLGGADVDVDVLERRLVALAQREELPLASLTRRLRALVCEEEQPERWQQDLFLDDLPQFSPRGHEVVAELLADELRQRHGDVLGGTPRQFAQPPQGTVNGRFLSPGGMLFAPTSYMARLDAPLPLRGARAIINEATSIEAGIGFYIEDGEGPCETLGGIAFQIAPSGLPHGAHVVRLDLLDSGGNTHRMDDRLELVTGLHFGGIDSPQDGDVLSEPLEITGWAVSMHGVLGVEIMLGNSLIASANCTLPRPDLVEQLGADQGELTPGFTVTLATLPAEPGDHAMTVRLITEDGERVQVGNPLRVTVPL